MSGIRRFVASTLGLKVLMAVTGIIGYLFLVGHLLGNLQLFVFPEGLNHEALLLRRYWPALWLARIVLLTCVGIHGYATAVLWWRNRTSRPIGYRVFRPPAVDYAAKTMIWSGPIVAAFVIFHILHLTTGTVLPSQYVHLDVYHNVISGFQVPWVAIFYIIANFLLAVHLYHGMWSLFQTMGWDHPAYVAARRPLAVVLAAFIGLGNMFIPFAVLSGLVG